jgi:hypothetical protein
MPGMWGTFADVRKAIVVVLILLVGAFFFGYTIGYRSGKDAQPFQDYKPTGVVPGEGTPQRYKPTGVVPGGGTPVPTPSQSPASPER